MKRDLEPVRRIRRVLIANRGEIARRIIHTCRKLGIESVAVFSEADRDSPHVREATTAVALTDPRGYLALTQIVEIARLSGADAVHPGYGFLSENPEFVDAVTKAGLTFIGPSATAMRALGSKVAAKELAQREGVPRAPTCIFTGTTTNALVEEVQGFAAQVGFPIILKAAAGGGGRGMRVLTDGSSVREEVESAQREALRAFGSAAIFAEKFIPIARHIEVQVAGDLTGNVVALGTRDCSLQRAHQKILEEAPAPNLPQETAERLCDAACRLARAAGYANLGTVEFLYAPDGTMHFLEMNTRLQVEHPVTEMVTGLDLVELQLRLAEGCTLESWGLTATPAPQGHAIEARLCAEEFFESFVIATGTIRELAVPETSSVPHVRVRADLGFEPGYTVTPLYDSMLGKVIAHAPTREGAIEGLRDVLSRTRVSGVGTNRGTLLHLLAQPEFHKVFHSVQGTRELLPHRHVTLHERERAHRLAAALRLELPYSAWAHGSPWYEVPSESQPRMFPYSSCVQNDERTSLVVRTRDGTMVYSGAGPEDDGDPEDAPFRLATECVVVDHTTREVSARVHAQGESFPVTVRFDGDEAWVHTPTGSVCVREVVPAMGHTGASEEGITKLTAPIPGRVASISAAVGETVSAGTAIIVLDSMKMEHPIRVPLDAVVTSLPVRVGTLVQGGAVLVELRRGGGE